MAQRADEQLKAVVTGSIQLLAVRDRAEAAGMDPDELLAIVEPVPVTNVELGQVEGRSPDDETAAFLMTMVLFFSISTYGAMVLSGVVEEKSSRTVEVLLERMPARNLLAGKIAGIGMLGLGQIAATAIVALVAASLADSFDVPAVRGSVIAWAVVWFVLGYALFATVFGTLGSLASRSEGYIERHRSGVDHPRSRVHGVLRRDRQRRQHVGATEQRGSRSPRHSPCPIASPWAQPRGGIPS